MATTIRIQEDTKEALNQLGGTFDNPNDVIQQLIQEAGYGNLLPTNEELTNYEPGKRKRYFRSRIKDELAVTELGKVNGMKSVWEYDTENGAKHLWLHADKNNDYWGWPKDPPDTVFKNSVIHVFLGPRRENCYIVPEDDIRDEFDLIESKEQTQIHREKQTELFEQYRDLVPIIN